MRIEVSDPDGSVWRRGVRMAIVLPAVFGAALTIGADTAAPFAAFAVVGALGMADFGGPHRRRALAYLGLTAIGAVYVALGTLCSGSVAVAVAGMLVIGFVTLLAGVFGGYVAGGTSATLLAFVLAVMTPGSGVDVPARSLGWVAGGLASTLGALLIWPRDERQNLQARAADVARSVAATVAGRSTGAATPDADLDGQVPALRLALVQTPYRPVGPGRFDRALLRTVELLARAAAFARRVSPTSAGSDTEQELARRTGETFARVAATLDAPGRSPASTDHDESLEDLRDRHRAELLERARSADPAEGSGLREAVEAADAAFPLRIESVVAAALEQAVGDLTAGTDTNGRAAGGAEWSARARALLREHLHPQSAWLRNTVRGSVALAGSVAVAQITGIDHSFWVVLGTLSVLRSNAIGTGASALRAIVGTLVGFAVATAVLALAEGSTAALWLLLPVVAFAAMWLAGAVNMIAGQAGFAVLVVVLFNIVEPIGWETGLVRLETVALGAAVAVVASTLFWPHGAEGVLRRDLGARYRSARDYLAEVLAASTDEPGGERADDAARRVADDAGRATEAFTEFLGERGTKRLHWTTWSPVLEAPDAVVFAADAVRALGDGAAGADRASSPELVDAVERNAAVVCQSLSAIADVLDHPRDGKVAGLLASDRTDVAGEIRRNRVLDALPTSLVGASGDREALLADLHLLWLAEWLAYVDDELRRLHAPLTEVVAAAAHPWWR